MCDSWHSWGEWTVRRGPDSGPLRFACLEAVVDGRISSKDFSSEAVPALSLSLKPLLNGRSRAPCLSLMSGISAGQTSLGNSAGLAATALVGTGSAL